MDFHGTLPGAYDNAVGVTVLDLGELIMILDLHRQGLTVSAISRGTGLDRKTVRKYIAQGLVAPSYGPRRPRPQVTDPYLDYLRERLHHFPGLSAVRLLRELRALGYSGGYTAVKDVVRGFRPPPAGFEHRFETPAGEQAQVDFAHFKVVFANEPTTLRVVWLFSMVLGHSRYLWARFVAHQDLHTVLRCHAQAFSALAGVPRTVLYDRMRTAVLGSDDQGEAVYNPALLDLARHFGFTPRACAAYRPQTKGKIERPFRYIRQDFFLGRTFQDLDDLNAQLADWLATVANVRVHGTTGQCVAAAYAAERPTLLPLPALPYRAVLAVERRISRDGMVAIGGNTYSVPDGIGQRAVEVQVLVDELQVLIDGTCVAVHALALGRGQRIVAPGHRHWPPPGRVSRRREGAASLSARPGDVVVRRPLSVYAEIAAALAAGGVA